MKTEARDEWRHHLREAGGCVVCQFAARFGEDTFCPWGKVLFQAAVDERDETMELWSLTSTGPVFGEVRGAQIFQTHPREVCEADGFPCCLHSPSDHHMRNWPMLWRADRRLMERTCEHLIGHPDPDDMAFHVRNERDYQGVHGCDGCCRPDKPVKDVLKRG